MGHRSTQSFKPLDRLGSCSTPDALFGNQAGNGPAMTRDDDTRPLLNFIKKLRQMSFRFRSLNFTHKVPTSCFN